MRSASRCGGYALPAEIALLASNESPWPPIPEVVEAAARAAAGANRYPDPSNAGLRRALADRPMAPGTSRQINRLTRRQQTGGGLTRLAGNSRSRETQKQWELDER